MKNEMTTCPRCHANLLAKNLNKHNRKVHRTENKVDVKKAVLSKLALIKNVKVFNSTKDIIRYLELGKTMALKPTDKEAIQGVVETAKYSKNLDLLKLKLIWAINSIDFANATLKKQNKTKVTKASNKKAKGSRKNKITKEFIKPLMDRKLDIDDLISSRRGLPQIGLGTKPITTIPKVKATDVSVDKFTHPKNTKSKYILYAAGWSLEGAFAK